MAFTTSNKEKEIGQRVCHLHGATECYLFIETGDIYTDELVNIPSEKLFDYLNKLESLTGMKFRLLNFSENKKEVNKLLFKSKKMTINFDIKKPRIDLGFNKI